MYRTAATIIFLVPVLGFADQWNKHFDTSDSPELRVTAGDAVLRIDSGNSNGIDIDVKTVGYSIGESGVRIEAQQNGNTVELQVHEPRSRHTEGRRHIEVNIRVPHTVSAFLKTGDGPMELKELHGALEATTGDGPIHVTAFDGRLRAHTGDGPLTLQGRFEQLEIHSGDGPVNLTVAHGSHLNGRWEIATGDGPVWIKVPDGLSADLALHSGDGPISLNLPVESQHSDKHNVHAKLNGGGPELAVHTGDGPVNISHS